MASGNHLVVPLAIPVSTPRKHMGKSIEVGNLSSDDAGERFVYVDTRRRTVRGRIVSITHTKQHTIVGFTKDGHSDALVIDTPQRRWIRVLYGNERA